MKNKCTDIEPCTALWERLEKDSVSKKKGLCEMRLINIHTGEDIRWVYFYKTSSKDRGAVINFCPFCGFEFLYERKGEKKKEGSA